MADNPPFSRNITGGANSVGVQFTQFDVYIATCTAADDPTQAPTWGDFTINKSLAVESLFFGSTFSGMSSAKLRLVPGIPSDTSTSTTRVEDINQCGHGDRVMIAIGQEPRWAGYCVGGAIKIEPESEGIEYRLVGPEWIWGDDPRNGSINPVYGQIRLQASADTPTGSPSYNDLFVVTDDLTVFNPAGRKNMNVTQLPIVNSSGGSTTPATGRVWDIPDRIISGDPKTAFWNVFQAVKTIVCWWNDPTKTGIDVADWGHAGTILDSGNPMPEANVDSKGIWGAVKTVLSPDYGMYVDPVPTTLGKFTGFTVNFFKRGEGDDANFYLNAPGTTMSSAQMSVARLEADKDTGKSINKVSVLGKATRHLQLQYYGDTTPTVTADQAKQMLQHGWGQTEGKLSDYAANNSIGQITVDDVTIGSKTADVSKKWADQFDTNGVQYTQFSHVFRLFIWNESGEFAPNNSTSGTPVYGQTESTYDWVTPDLKKIADADGFVASGGDPGKYCLRRRKLLDTVYLGALQSIDGWRRVPPTLYFACLGVTNTTQSPWVRVSRQSYKLDPERCAIWMTHPNISTWQPFIESASEDDATLDEERTFTTLLHTGKLRMMLEASIDCDTALTALADRQATAGSPLIRQGILRAGDRYVQSLALAGAANSPSGIIATPLDTSADALTLARRLRTSGERQQAHASVLTEPDWPEQKIGTMITQTNGRTISLQTEAGSTGPGAQIVGKSIHLDVMKWEYVTESRAAELHAQHRKFKKGRQVKKKPMSWHQLGDLNQSAWRASVRSGVVIPEDGHIQGGT